MWTAGGRIFQVEEKANSPSLPPQKTKPKSGVSSEDPGHTGVVGPLPGCNGQTGTGEQSGSDDSAGVARGWGPGAGAGGAEEGLVPQWPGAQAGALIWEPGVRGRTLGAP